MAATDEKAGRGGAGGVGGGVASIDEVIECHRMAGDVDYLLKRVVRDIAHYDRIYRRLIAAVPDLADVSSSFSMERMKHTTALPRPV